MIKKIKSRKTTKRSIRAARPAGRRASGTRRRKALRRPALAGERDEFFTL